MAQANLTSLFIFVFKDDGLNPWFDEVPEGPTWEGGEEDTEISSDVHLPPIQLEQPHLRLFHTVVIAKGIHWLISPFFKLDVY